MNRELLQNVRDVIGAEAERFEMNNWITYPKVGEPLDGDCGTAGCLAGHVVFTAAKMGLVQGFASSWSSVVVIDDQERSVPALAVDLIDDLGQEWYVLFGIGNWPEHYVKDRHEHVTPRGGYDRAWQAKMAMELIDDILDGLTVWDEDRGQWVYLPDDATAEDEPAD